MTKARLAFGAVVLAGAGCLAAVVGGLVLWMGLYDVAASSPHTDVVAWLLHFAMQRSVANHAPVLQPPNLDDPTLILRGALHYANGCAPCHGAPGQLASPIAQQMDPVPPGLYSAAVDFDPSQLFWIVRNGIKMTPMPAWPARDRADEIWAMVAFLETLPTLNTQGYAALAGSPSSTALLAASPPSSGNFDPTPCTSCHGADGRGRKGAFPSIAGLDENRLAESLRGYRDGSHPSGFMQPVAATMSDAQIDAAARYYANLASDAAP